MPAPESPHLRLHYFLAGSRANGPGLRAVIWMQGCTLNCPGCYNPGTHDPGAGEYIAVTELAERVAELAGKIDGVTISGGEPFQQAQALAGLCCRLRQDGFSILIFTGFEPTELARLPHADQVLANCDVLIHGRYRQEQRLARGLLGSANKQLLFLTDRYNLADFADIPEAEVIITPQGEVVLSGIDPVR